jgi:UDP-N-acetylglucosamine 4,6-dehydratase
MNWSEKTVLLTGGTGSFGKKFTEILLKEYKPKALRVFSRDELKQSEMIEQFSNHPSLRFFIGDIRDTTRLNRAMDGVDIVVHAAALKQVPSCEYNPFEAVQTNILGAENIINAAIDNNVEKILALSTDKAVNPANFYGATKMCMEKLFIAANAYVGQNHKTKMSCVRYGNVVGSRGSVVPILQRQKETGTITITDKRMTRFWITLDQGVRFVIKSIEIMDGREVFIPKIPSMNIMDMVKAIAPDCKVKIIGIRPGEKIDECLLTEEEARNALEYGDFFVIEPSHNQEKDKQRGGQGKELKEGFRYTSDKNTEWLTVDQLKKMI